MNDLPQGDLRLLSTEVAERLLHSTIPARLAYTALDGTPRVLASRHVWTGEELVMSTFVSGPPLGSTRPAGRLRALRAHPDVAVIIDTGTEPPEVLQSRGRVSVTTVDGMVAEQAEAARRFLGADGAAAYVAGADHPGTTLARIALRPTWVGVLDFATRFPGVMQA